MNPLFGMVRALAGKFFVPHLARKLQRFQAQLKTARTIQRQLMLDKVRRCKESRFGRDHHFAEIKTRADFCRNIPIAAYDYYEPYIAAVTQGDVEAMFPTGEKLLMFTLSSGTTAAPKLIPVNSTWMNEYRRGWQLWGIKAFLDHPALFYAKLAGVAGNWDMRRTPTHIPCGMASGLSARMQHPLLKMVYSAPACVHEIDDPDAKYYAILRMSIAEPNTGLFMTATPATVIQFAKLGDKFREILIRDIHDGSLATQFNIPDPIRQELGRRIGPPRPQRAAQLEQIVQQTGRLYPKDYWNLSLVACWIGGTVGSYARHLPIYYGATPSRDIGLLCSEGRFTIPLEDGVPAGALEIISHYYEFVPEDEIQAANPTVLECHELEVGKSYYILLTTSSGLYRYNIQDVLRCTGFIGETPILEFLHKGQRISDLEGEKISEYHLVRAVTEAAHQLDLTITGFTAVPVRPDAAADNAGPPYYAFMFEEQDLTDRPRSLRFLHLVDRWLCDHNVMYAGKRNDRYLSMPRLVRIPKGSWARYDADEIKRRGVGADHYKHPCLVMDQAFLRQFDWVEELIPSEGCNGTETTT